jgi:hypothetical protein
MENFNVCVLGNDNFCQFATGARGESRPVNPLDFEINAKGAVGSEPAVLDPPGMVGTNIPLQIQ